MCLNFTNAQICNRAIDWFGLSIIFRPRLEGTSFHIKQNTFDSSVLVPLKPQTFETGFKSAAF